MEGAAVVSPPPQQPSTTTSSPSSTSSSTSNINYSRARSADVQSQQQQQQAGSSSGKNYQMPQRFRTKRDKSRQHFHSSTGASSTTNSSGGGGGKKDLSSQTISGPNMCREDMNLNNLLSTTRHGLHVPFPMSPPGPMAGGGGCPFNYGGGGGPGGMFMFPTPNGHVLTKIGPYKEPLLPSGPPPFLLHHGGLNLSPLAYAQHQANMKAAMQAVGMFSPARKDHSVGFKFPPPHPPPPPQSHGTETPKPPAYPSIDLHKARIHSRSESASHLVGGAHSRLTSTSSVGNLGAAVHDPSLKKLMKDLHRCEVSIARYQTMLNEHCDAGLRFLHQAFITLHIGLNAREKDIARELQMTRETASTILQHRHTTACVLRQLGEKASELEETQLHELKKQIRQFVVDRKVDEEIGTTSRLIADPDDLLPYVMGFGKVVNRRHVYTSWEGDPVAAVERSKHSNTKPVAGSSRSSGSVFSSSPPSSLPTTPSPTISNGTTSEMKSNKQGLCSGQRYDDSVFNGESPLTKKLVARGGEKEEGDEGGRDDECDGDNVRCGKCEECDDVEESNSGNGREHNSSSSSSHSFRDCGHNKRPSFTSPPPSVVADEEEPRKPHPLEPSVDSTRQNCTTSSCSSSSASFNHTASTATTTTAPPSTVAGGGSAKPASLSHKTRQPFSRRFAAPIVVTHTRRSFPKQLPKNLDPKSTVTLLLCSSPSSSSDRTQQKHGKYGKNHRSTFGSSRSQLSSLYQQSLPGDGVTQDDSLTQLPSPSPSPSLLKGREKERELWRKRFSGSLHTNSTNSSSSSIGCVTTTGAGVTTDSSRSEFVTTVAEEGEGGARVKRSPEEISAIQSRVRESLRAQGVFLYDPVTGTIPADARRGDSVDSGLGKSEPHPDPLHAPSDHLKKKTPTQLRRERKKRQRERERRQKELEQKRSQEEGGNGGCSNGDKQRSASGGGERVLLLDKTSSSTSRTTSPLSSLDNHTSSEDTPTESLSLSLSQSPPPPPSHSCAHSEPDRDMVRGRTSEKSATTNQKQVSDTDKCALTTSDIMSPTSNNCTADSTLHSVAVECGSLRRNGEDAPVLMTSDSASIEWEMSRQQRREKRVNVPSSPLTPQGRIQTSSTGISMIDNHVGASPLHSSPSSSLNLNGSIQSDHNHFSAHLTPSPSHNSISPPVTITKLTPGTTTPTAPSYSNCNTTTDSSSTHLPSSPTSHPKPHPASYPPHPLTHSNEHDVPHSPTHHTRLIRDIVCPAKLQRNGSDEAVLIINGHEE